MRGPFVFPDDVEPSQEAVDWLEKVNVEVRRELDRAVVELMLFGSTMIWKPAPETFGRGAPVG